MVRPTTPQTVLITGASSGIGHEMARIFAEHRFNLVLVARSQSQLDEIAATLRQSHGVSAHGIAQNLGIPDAPAELFAKLQQQGLAIDILVNNAGFAVFGPFAESDLNTQLRLLQLNIVSMTHLVRLLLPHMLGQGFGRVLNVASISAYMPGPLLATYFASKAYVLSFSEALANELAGTGVTVTTLCPGPTRTKFELRSGLSGTKAFRSAVMEPAEVARIGFEAVMAGKRTVIPGLLNKLRMLPTRLMPRPLLAEFARIYHQM